MIKNKFIHLIISMVFFIFVPVGLFAADAELVSVHATSSSTAKVGDELTLTLTVTNNGPADTTDINVTKLGERLGSIEEFISTKALFSLNDLTTVRDILSTVIPLDSRRYL